MPARLCTRCGRAAEMRESRQTSEAGEVKMKTKLRGGERIEGKVKIQADKGGEKSVMFEDEPCPSVTRAPSPPPLD